MAADASHVVGNTYRALVPAGVRRRVSTQVSREARTRVKHQLTVVAGPADRISTNRVQRRLQHALPSSEGTRTLPGGRLAQVHPGLTPAEVLRHNLELVTHALDAAGVAYFAVPAVNDRHGCLAVPASDRVKVYRALAAVFRDIPGTVEQLLPKPRAAKAHYGPNIRFSRLDGATVVRVGWLRSDPTGGLVIGTSVSVEIEFWTRQKNHLVGPRQNRVMRKIPVTAPETEAALRHFTQYGDPEEDRLRLRTREFFTAPRSDEITFAVDAALLWTRADDPALLRATLRSLHQHAPWIRRIHLVTTGRLPSWVADHPRLRVHPATLSGGLRPEDLRARLHLLPGLAEHFVLLPAGSVLGQRAKPHLFFTPFGYLRFLATEPDVSELPDTPWRVAVEQTFGRAVTGGLRPGPQPRLRSLTATLADALPLGQPRTPLEQAGMAADPLDCLHLYWAHAEGRALPGSARSIALRADAPDLDARLLRLLARRDTALLHFSGLGDPTTPPDAVRRIRELLDTFFPVPSPYERQEPAAGGPLRPTDPGARAR